MRYNYLNKTSLKPIIGIPIIMLILSLTLPQKSVFSSESEDFNPYFNPLTLDYIRALEHSKYNDSTYFYGIIDNSSRREIIIFKEFPDDTEVLTNFNLSVFPKDKTHLEDLEEFLSFNITNDAAKYSFNGKIFGVFKMAIPLINIEKIELKVKTVRDSDKAWTATIDNPFKTIESIIEVQKMSDKGVTITPSPYTFLLKKVLKSYDLESASYNYNIENNLLVQSSTIINDKDKKTIAHTKGISSFWKKINNKDKSLSNTISFNGDFSELANSLIEEYVQEKLPIESVFDLTKIAAYNSILNVFTSGCDDEIYLFFNKNSNLIEPFFKSSNCLGQMSKSFNRPLIEDVNYLSTYTKILYNISELDISEGYVKEDLEFKQELALINSYYPKTLFNYDIIEINQRVIKKALNPTGLILSDLISMNKQRMVLAITNTSDFPIDIYGLTYQKNKNITQLDVAKQVLSLKTDTVSIEIPRSFENLFVSKKNKIVGFNLSKHIYDLSLSYAITGLTKKHNTSIMPYEQVEKIKEDLFRSKSIINNHKDIVINSSDKKITFSKDSVVISSPLVISRGFTFELKPGTKINIIAGGKIISHSPLNFIGTEQEPIHIFSSDKKGQGFLILSEGENSILKHVIFSDLTNPRHGGWNITGALTFYESPVNLEHVSIKNNRCEDALNIVRTHFSMKECQISNTQSDGFDGDFVKGTIVNCSFNNLGNDAIDVSGSDLIINRVVISAAGDKGLSAGEDSKMTINDISISNSEIAIAGKDLSIINAVNIRITNTKLGFTAFKKKPEFGPSNMTINGLVMDNVETNYLIESSSSLFVDGKKIETSQNVKDRMYGVEFGKSSAETRNNQ